MGFSAASAVTRCGPVHGIPCDSEEADGPQRERGADCSAPRSAIPRDRSSREVEGKAVRAAATIRRGESPPANAPADALLNLRRACAAPAASTHVDARHVAGTSERNRDVDLTGEIRVDLQPVLLVAEAELRLTRAYEVAQV